MRAQEALDAVKEGVGCVLFVLIISFMIWLPATLITAALLAFLLLLEGI